jgi:hypothetical protein
MEEIWEALEASTVNSKKGMFDSVTPSKRDHLNRRDDLLRFLNEVDPGLTVGELVLGLEEYQ